MAEGKSVKAGLARSLYERDFLCWTEQMSARLRNRESAGLDWENLAEEIESLGRSDRRELRSRLSVLLMHLLKWQHQPELRDGSTWSSTIREQRRRIAELLEESPSLVSQLPEIWEKSYLDASEDAADEMRVARHLLPQTCPYTQEEVLDPAFLPQ